MTGQCAPSGPSPVLSSTTRVSGCTTVCASLPPGQHGGACKAVNAGAVPCSCVESRRNGGSAFREHTLQQHRLLSGPVAAYAGSYLSTPAEGIAQLPVLPGELYILAGQFATGDEREYKYGLDITLSLPPRCRWDERYGTNCSSGDYNFCQLWAAARALSGSTARVGNLGMCRTPLMEIYAELISAWWKGRLHEAGIDFKESVAIIFFCRLTNLKCCHFFQFTLGRITLRLSSREAEDSSCILPVNHVYRRQSTCRGLSCSLPMSGSYLHILCSAEDKEDFYIKRERFPPVVQVTVAKCVISLPSVPLVHSDRYLATCLQTPASRRSALLLELDLCKWFRWAVLLRACIFGSQRACLHEGKLNYHLRSCRIDDELGWLKSRSELWPVRSDSDMCFFLRILVGAASKIIMCNCCEHPAEGLGTAGSKQGQLLEDTGEAKFWELRLNISCCVLIAVLKTPQLLLT